jgi:hypothetical protein
MGYMSFKQQFMKRTLRRRGIFRIHIDDAHMYIADVRSSTRAAAHVIVNVTPYIRADVEGKRSSVDICSINFAISPSLSAA